MMMSCSPKEAKILLFLRSLFSINFISNFILAREVYLDIWYNWIYGLSRHIVCKWARNFVDGLIGHGSFGYRNIGRTIFGQEEN